MSREAHAESVAVATAEVTALAGRIIAASEKQSETLAAIVRAVGDPPGTEAGSFSVGITAEIGDSLAELIGRCEQVEMELTRYLNGF